MRHFIVLLSIVALFGCSYTEKAIQNYWEKPETLLKDPHFAEYQAKREHLESKHLNQEITYEEYYERLNALEKKYERDIQRREGIVFDHDL